ncbi:hypothetical protein C0J52_22334 [Blattella germanica]|nr:hypothetical protein C0J52_22334 [Blattella germanica]
MSWVRLRFKVTELMMQRAPFIAFGKENLEDGAMTKSGATVGIKGLSTVCSKLQYFLF